MNHAMTQWALMCAQLIVTQPNVLRLKGQLDFEQSGICLTYSPAYWSAVEKVKVVEHRNELPALKRGFISKRPLTFESVGAVTPTSEVDRPAPSLFVGMKSARTQRAFSKCAFKVSIQQTLLEKRSHNDNDAVKLANSWISTSVSCNTSRVTESWRCF